MNPSDKPTAPPLDFSKINPKDISYSMGPALTEEQFKEYCKKSGTKPTIIGKKSG